MQALCKFKAVTVYLALHVDYTVVIHDPVPLHKSPPCARSRAFDERSIRISIRDRKALSFFLSQSNYRLSFSLRDRISARCSSDALPACHIRVACDVR